MKKHMSILKPSHLKLNLHGMKKGDLVRVIPTDTDIRGRTAGIILEFDSYHPDSSSLVIPIAKVLWPDKPGWIDLSRIEKIGGCITTDAERQESFWKMWGHI